MLLQAIKRPDNARDATDAEVVARNARGDCLRCGHPAGRSPTGSYCVGCGWQDPCECWLAGQTCEFHRLNGGNVKPWIVD